MKNLKLAACAALLFVTACDENETPGNKPINDFYTLEANGQLPVSVRGNPASNTAIIIVHGGPGIGAIGIFDPTNDFLSALEKDHLVVLYDQRGAGGLTSGEGLSVTDFNFEKFTNDLYQIVESVKTKYKPNHISLLGHSFGGQLAIEYLHRYPNTIASWIAMDAAHDESENVRLSKSIALEILEDLTATGVEEIELGEDVVPLENVLALVENIDYTNYTEEEHVVLELILDEAGAQELADGTDVLTYFLTQDYTSTPASFSIDILLENIMHSEESWEEQELHQLDQSEKVTSITIPSLIIWGENDLVFPIGNAMHLFNELGSAAPDRLIVVIPNAGHFSFIDEPLIAANAVKGFINSL